MRGHPLDPKTSHFSQESSKGQARRGFLRDLRGHTFLLAGLLLVMGTVTLGGVFVTMSMSEDKVVRDQRDNLMEPVSSLLGGFNESVRNMVAPGETNVSTFKDRLLDLEERAHAQAAKDGIFLTIRLMDPADPSLWSTSGRCPSYDPFRSEAGVVVGYDLATRQETIVGAAVELQATDGHQVVRFPYYVKLYDCLPTSQVAWFSDIRVVDGWVLNPEYALSANDNNAAMRIGELPKGEMVIIGEATQDEDTIGLWGWNNERYLAANDGNSAHHPATPLSDFLLFKFDLDGVPTDLILSDVQVQIHAWHVAVIDDYLQARIIHNGTVMHTWHPATTTSEELFVFDIPLSPSGTPTWKVHELADVVIEFQVIEVGKFDPNAFFHVQYVELNFEYTVPEKHAFEATFEWPIIPTIYDRHFIEVRYRFDNATPDETFLLQVKSDGSWQTRIDMTPTAGGWNAISYQLLPIEIESGIVEMRIVDSITDDRWSDDADEVEIDYLMIRSEMDT